MKARELLQIELWSKETSRKLLIGFGIAFGLCLIGLFGWYEVEVRWLTSGEREKARAALRAAEEFDKAEPLSNIEFDARRKQLDARVKAAEAAAKTIRDHSVEMRLYWYTAVVEMEYEKRTGKWATNSDDTSRKTDSIIAQLKEEHRKALHRALD